MPSLNVAQRASRMARDAREAVTRVFHKKKSTPVDVPPRDNVRSRVPTERRPRHDAISDEVKAASQPAPIVRFVDATIPLRAPSNITPKKTPQRRLQRKPRVSRRPLRHEPIPQVTSPVPAPINTSVSPRPVRPLPARKGRKGVGISVSSSPVTNIPAPVISGPLPPILPLPIRKVRQVVSVSTALSGPGFPPPVFAQKNGLLEELFPGKKASCKRDAMEDLWLELFGPDPDAL